LKVVRDDMEFYHLPLIDIMLDLEENKKGIHMSRSEGEFGGFRK